MIKLIEGTIQVGRNPIKCSPDELYDHALDDAKKQGDEELYWQFKRGEWHYDAVTCSVKIKTQLTDRSWVYNELSVPCRGRIASYQEKPSQGLILQVLLDMFEVLRTLGFLKQQIISAIPKEYQPSFRREISKIVHQKERIYQ